MAAIDLYFIEEDGSTFKATLKYEPYFYIAVKQDTEREVENMLKRQYEHLISQILIVEKEDLDMVIQKVVFYIFC